MTLPLVLTCYAIATAVTAWLIIRALSNHPANEYPPRRDERSTP